MVDMTQWKAEHAAKQEEIRRKNAPAQARYEAQKARWDSGADAWLSQYGEQAKARQQEWKNNPVYTPTPVARLDNPRQTFYRPTTARSASQSFAESFESVGMLIGNGRAVGAVNAKGQVLMFDESTGAAGLKFEPFLKADKSGFMSPGKVKATWTPPENWSAEVAERYTLPSIETKSALAEQKKLFDDQLAQLKEKQAAAKAEGAELQAGVKRSEDEGEELKALTAATRERLSQLALSETKIRAGLIDKSRGQAAARRGMTGGRESLFSLSERGFEEGVASYSPRGQRARERNLLSVAEQAAPAGVASGPYANLLSPEAAAALAARASRYPRWTPR